MIQRIQTIFLLLAVVSQALFLSFPIASYVMGSTETFDFFARGLKDSSGEVTISLLPMFIIGIIVLILAIIDIFLYKKRILQIRVCIYSILLNISLIGLMIWQLISISKEYETTSQSYGMAIVMPLVSIILLFLAFRGIRKDEVLVKAYDRLR